MRIFFTVWGGQLVSVVGTAMSGFGLSIWIYVETGSVTKLAMVSLAFALPAIVLSPIAGALVDRWDRRWVMLGADTIAGLGTLAIALLFMTDHLQLWHIYVVAAVGAVANTFQMPAWMASIPLLVAKGQLGRANGMVQLNNGLSTVAAPLIAGVLLAAFDLPGVLVVDLATFVVALVTLALVRFPRPDRHAETSTETIRGDAIAGWRWVKDRPGLFGLLWVFAGTNVTLSFTNVLLFPLVLAFASEASAGTVVSIAGLGIVSGSIAASAWGGPRRRILGMMVSVTIGGLFVALTGVHAAVWSIAAAAFCFMAIIPIVNTTSAVLWQVKVPPALQGRVVSIRRMISQAISPIAILSAGPLADKVFEPMLARGGSLSPSVGSIIGTGPGRGIGFMFIVSGIATAILGGIGYALPRVRHVETELPDHVG